MFEKKTLNLYSIIIGIFFLISGFGKVIDTAGFSNLIEQYGLGYLSLLSPVIVVFEIVLGLFLIFLINPKRDSMISAFLLIVFTISFAYAFLAKGVQDCGCFGSVQHTNLPPLFSFIRNFLLIIMSLLLWVKYPKGSSSVSNWQRYIIFLIVGVSLFVAGYTYKLPYFMQRKEKEHEFYQKNIKQTNLSKYINTSSDSTYLVFCFSYTCPYCWNSIENLKQFTKTKTVDRIVVFAVGDLKDKQVFEQNFKPDFPIIDLPSAKMDELTKAYPTAFYVQNDSVRVVIETELPSPFVFRKMYLVSAPIEKK